MWLAALAKVGGSEYPAVRYMNSVEPLKKGGSRRACGAVWRWVTHILVISAVVLVAVGAVWYQQTRLPHPSEADSEQLLRWMVLRDLREEPAELRCVLACRLEEEFGGKAVDWDGVSERLSNSSRGRASENFLTLLRPWLSHKLAEYEGLAPKDRLGHLDRVLDIRATLEQGAAKMDAAPAEDERRLVERAQEEIERWRDEASTAERGSITQYLVSLETRRLTRPVSVQSAEAPPRT